MLPITFRKLGANDRPAPGELWIRAAAPGDRSRRALAQLVFERGLEVLETGEAPLEQMVVDAGAAQPTLDEMLAAHFAQRLLEKQALSPAYGKFAQYAGTLRQGKRPTNLPPEETLEGIYQVLRSRAGSNLTDPAVAGRFLAGWRRLARRLDRAAAEHAPIFHQSLFAEEAEWTGERADLIADQQRYRHDVYCGERWTVHLPGTAYTEAGLFLRQPKSFQFPYWSRTDSQTPTGQPYLFLVVAWGQGEWDISTDPTFDVKLKDLADLLQREEEAVGRAGATHSPSPWLQRLGQLGANGRRLLRGRRAQHRAGPNNGGEQSQGSERAAKADRPGWYDGRDHNHTIISAPRGGSRLSDDRVLALIRGWAKAKRWVAPRPAAASPVSFTIRTGAVVATIGLVLLIASRSQSDSSGWIATLYPKVAPAVVMANAGTEIGSGFLIAPDGWIVTNSHVIAPVRTGVKPGARPVTIFLSRLEEGRFKRAPEPLRALVYKDDAIRDLALLKLVAVPRDRPSLPFLTPAEPAEGRAIRVGRDFLSIGHGTADSPWMVRSVEVGQVVNAPEDLSDIAWSTLNLSKSARDEFREVLSRMRVKVILSPRGLSPGDSGGPLVDRDGKVIGVAWAIRPDANDPRSRYTYFIHLDVLREFLADWPGAPKAPLPLPPLPRLPGDWPHEPHARYELTGLVPNGQYDAVLFHEPGAQGGPAGVSLWCDVRRLNAGTQPEDLDDPRKDPVKKGQWRYQFALRSKPFPTAYYDTDGGGRIDLVVQAPFLPRDEETEIRPDVLWRLKGGEWVSEVVAGDRPLISADWFNSAGDLWSLFQDYAPKLEGILRGRLKP